jgi:phenylalanyl-tRNA synthetase beta chain
MKISLNWIKEFTEVDLSIDDLTEKIGAQIGAIDEVIDVGENLNGVLVVRVVACDKHPNASKLSICLIDDNGKNKDVKRTKDGHVQVVCGAPNVKAGILAAWIPPGMIVPATVDKDPFTIEAKDIRGQLSSGMLASPKELAIGDSHEGLLIVDNPGTKAGDRLVDTYGLDDYVIDIENKMFTHRPDLFGHLGVAREIAGVQGHKFKSPDWYVSNPRLLKPNDKLKFAVKNEVPGLVSRFCAVAISGVKVGPSPDWLQSRLSRLGVKPINNVVDITNYIMLETAQPLHAYDYDKVGTAKLGIRLSKNGEKLTLLGNKQIELKAGSIVITDGQKPIGMGGVMGGADTEVDADTKNIILECATFNMNAIRKTAMEYGLFTDAATRFTKNQSPLQNLAVMLRAVEKIQKVAGGEAASKIIDEKSKLSSPVGVKVSPDFISSRLGVGITAARLKELLQNVEFDVAPSGKSLNVTAPFWRTDIALPEDVVEEVGRLYGYDKLVLELPTRNIGPARLNASIGLDHKVRSVLARGGVNELLTYSFVHSSLLQKAGQDPAKAYKLRNALSPDLQYYRLSITPSLLEKVHPNIKLGYDQLAIFEIGKIHNNTYPNHKTEKVPFEAKALALVFAASKAAAKDNGAAFYQAKAYLEFLTSQLGVKLQYKPPQESSGEVMKPFEVSRSAEILTSDGQALGIVGEYKDGVIGRFKLPNYAAGFEINLANLLGAVPNSSNYQKLSRYPKVEQDISLKVPDGTSYADLLKCIEKELSKSKPRNSIAHFKPLSIYQSEGDKKHKTVSFRLNITSNERTLTSAEVNNLLDDISEAAKNILRVTRV